MCFNMFIFLNALLFICFSDFMRLVSGTVALESGKVFDIIAEDDTITLFFDVDGGMRAKWRKKRMRRLRRKRRKMRQRAR